MQGLKDCARFEYSGYIEPLQRGKACILNNKSSGTETVLCFEI